MIASRMLCSLLAAVAPSLASCVLETVWTRDIAGPGSAPTAAVLPRGQVFLADPRGRYWIAGADGRLRAEGSDPDLRGLRVLASDPDGVIYALLENSVVKLRPNPPEPLRLLGRIKLSLAATDIAADGEGRLYAAGILRSSPLPLHRIGPDGAVERSFGERPGPYRGSVTGNLLWDELRRRLLFIPLPLREVQAYDPEGNLIAVGGLGWFQPVAAPILPVGGPRGAALLPGGELAMQHGERVIAIYDSRLERLCEARDPWLGRLLGASPEGDLFFLTVGRLSRVRLRGIALSPGGPRLRPALCVTPDGKRPAHLWPPKPMLSAYSKISASPTSFASTRWIPTIFPPSL